FRDIQVLDVRVIEGGPAAGADGRRGDGGGQTQGVVIQHVANRNGGRRAAIDGDVRRHRRLDVERIVAGEAEGVQVGDVGIADRLHDVRIERGGIAVDVDGVER